MLRRGLLISFCLLAPVLAAPFSNLYFFGDSLSDTGNVYITTSILNSAFFGIVPVQPASPPYAVGRFSNGPVWTEQFASRLDQPADAQQGGMYLGPFGSLPGTGNNYAIGGAKTSFGGALGDFDALVPTGVFFQSYFYLSKAGTADPNALYVIAAGGNDIRAAAQLATTTERQAAMDLAADYLAVTLFSLYNAGARNFFVMDAPNVGNSPEALIVRKNAAQATEATNFFNSRVNSYTTYLDSLAGVNLTYFDLFGLSNQLYADALGGGGTYGFTNATTPCLAGFAGSKGADCSKSLFADDLHPSSAVHTLLGNMAADQILGMSPLLSSSLSISTPEPASFVLAGVGLLALAVWRRH